MESIALDAAGHRRSPATMPGYHQGRPPRNKGMRYPADPPTIEGIVAVMRVAGDGPDGLRLRALIVLLWRAGLGSAKRSRLPKLISIDHAARFLSGAATEESAARLGWTAGPGSSSRHGSSSARACRSERCSA
jgi:hypothetical protein